MRTAATKRFTVALFISCMSIADRSAADILSAVFFGKHPPPLEIIRKRRRAETYAHKIADERTEGETLDESAGIDGKRVARCVVV